MVTVIAIIGILAAVLIPSIINYIKKAQRKADLANAKQMYTTINNIVTEAAVGEIQPIKNNYKVNDVAAAYYNLKGSGNTYAGVQVYSKGEVETYDLVVTARLSGKQISGYSKKNYLVWNPVQDENKAFVDVLNKRMFETGSDSYVGSNNSKYMFPLLYSPNTKTGKQVDLWIIGWRRDNQAIEIWVGDSSQWGGIPLYRVYPSPADEYDSVYYSFQQTENTVYQIKRG